MKPFSESLGQMTSRIKSGGARKPLRTFVELCAELGVPQKTVMGRLKMDGAPVPELKHDTSRGKAAWYEPIGFKKWWASLDQVKPTIPTRHCDECNHMHYSNDEPTQYKCQKGHHPRWFKQTSPIDTSYGFKRRCEDFDGEFK